MDGNGRWATERKHLRMWGHVRGAKVVSNIIEEAVNLNLKALTLYTFSTENWSRPQNEITTLFKLLRKFLLLEKNKILKQNVRFRVMGEFGDFPKDVLDVVNDIANASKDNTGLKMTLALGYGSRNEIVSAVNKLIKQKPQGNVTEVDIDNALYLPDLGDVDLMIRTGGDHRLSNFLLWQMAYAEFFFTETRWPDFRAREFRTIIQSFATRERRFGNIETGQTLHGVQGEALKNRDSLTSANHKDK
jgi:undecaprenyl diphosphate synthase